MRAWIVVLVSLFVALPALAQDWATGAPVDFIQTKWDQAFTWSFTGVSTSPSNQDVSACSKPVVTVLPTDADVTLYDCPDTTAGFGQCTSIAYPTPAVETQVHFPRGFVKANVVSTSGPGSVKVECRQVLNQTFASGEWVATYGSGGGGFSNGVSAGIGNETTYTLLDDLERIQVRDRRLNPIFVNGTTGNDTTGNGTLTAPFATIVKAYEAVGWFAGVGSSAAVCGAEIIVAPGTYDGAGNFPPLSQAFAGIGAEIGVECPSWMTGDDVGIYVRAQDPANPPKFNCSVGGSERGWFITRGVSGSTDPADYAWIVFENIDYTCAADAFSQNGAHKVLCLNCTATASGNTNNVFTTHDTGWGIFIGGGGVAGAGTTVASISGAFVNTSTAWVLHAGLDGILNANNAAPIQCEGQCGVFGGRQRLISGTASNGYGISLDMRNRAFGNTPFQHIIVRANPFLENVSSGNSTLRLRPNPSQAYNVYVRQMTAGDHDSDLIALLSDAAGGAIDVDLRGAILQAPGSRQVFDNQSANYNAGYTLNIRDVIVPATGGFNYRIGGQFYATPAEARASGNVPAGWTFFENEVTTDSLQWEITNGKIPGQPAIAAESQNAAHRFTYTTPLVQDVSGNDFCIPGFVLGDEVCQFTLTAEVRGAR